MIKIVGIGEYALTNNTKTIIKTYALASCVAVTIYSPIKKIGGLIHIALPFPSEIKEEKLRPYYYASTGVPLFIQEVLNDFKCLKGELQINIYGGANSIRNNDIFNIGKKNIETTKKILDAIGLKYNYENLGGTVSRTVEMKISTGKIKVYEQPIRI